MDDAKQKIDIYIAAQEEWQKQNLITFRQLVHQKLPHAVEAWKWMVPVFVVDGRPICAMSVFKNHTKYNFLQGASLSDNHGIFNNGLDSKMHRSIDLYETDSVPTEGISELLGQYA